MNEGNVPATASPDKGSAVYPSEEHECFYPHGDGACQECGDLAALERTRAEIERAITAHCEGGDLWLCSMLAARNLMAGPLGVRNAG